MSDAPKPPAYLAPKSQSVPQSLDDVRAHWPGFLRGLDQLQDLPASADHPRRSDYDLNPGLRSLSRVAKVRPAAVLVAIVARQDGLHVLLTKRSAHLPSHAGQIAFPGGKIDLTDAGPVEAALREAEEEVGLPRALAEPIGALDPYETATGYEIQPIVGLIRSGFDARPEPGEVDAIFEVPLDFLMNPDHHQRHSRIWQGSRRYFFAMPYGPHYIWGATAGILRNLYDRIST